MQVCSRRFLTGQAAGGWDVPVRQTETSERRQLQEVLIVQQEAQAIPYQQLPVSLRVSLHGFLPSTLPYLFTALFVPYRERERGSEWMARVYKWSSVYISVEEIDWI